jgi:hypothetical protein
LKTKAVQFGLLPTLQSACSEMSRRRMTSTSQSHGSSVSVVELVVWLYIAHRLPAQCDNWGRLGSEQPSRLHGVPSCGGPYSTPMRRRSISIWNDQTCPGTAPSSSLYVTKPHIWCPRPVWCRKPFSAAWALDGVPARGPGQKMATPSAPRPRNC